MGMPSGGAADSRILLIASDNTFAHTYSDLAELLAEPAEGDRLGGAVEFFDSTGRRLAPVFDPQWTLVDLRPGDEPADPTAIQRRLRAVRDHVEWFLTTHPDVAERARLSVAEAVATLPPLGRTLTEDIDLMPWHHEGSRGNFLHNAMHAAGWAH
ncbi:hypothetical protein [Micromonospora endolithica]|uniref:Uncharacterized protein n=1 Tax=Micromonospora endolithica TaxID=230091 RepID=A0A3A9ZJN2_9ACTN|nr:hypothetical protein [Micromonospora endolithica]RKN47617.1 hypothetical protein D7223_12690 [Micromonospora endolithica]TWJ21273.1 hypothetical protein JD76_01383 [Micromonospora endolithica]